MVIFTIKGLIRKIIKKGSSSKLHQLPFINKSMAVMLLFLYCPHHGIAYLPYYRVCFQKLSSSYTGNLTKEHKIKKIKNKNEHQP